MLLKNHLIEVFKQASLEDNSLLKENIVIKWVHRFGFDSLNDLLSHSPVLEENQYKEVNQEQISLIDEVDKEVNQEQISLIDEVDKEVNQEQIKFELKNLGNIEETKWESNGVEISCGNGVFSNNQNSNNNEKLIDNQKLPLPNIKNLRKWINNDKKAS